MCEKWFSEYDEERIPTLLFELFRTHVERCFVVTHHSNELKIFLCCDYLIYEVFKKTEIVLETEHGTTLHQNELISCELHEHHLVYRQVQFEIFKLHELEYQIVVTSGTIFERS